VKHRPRYGSKKYHRERLLSAQNWLCFWCSRRLNWAQKDIRPTLDHVIPQSEGGSHEAENLVVACYRCNSERNFDLLHARRNGIHWNASNPPSTLDGSMTRNRGATHTATEKIGHNLGTELAVAQ
jgi:5-methylcytosine-specific restriction endonuclease McrA